MCLLVNKSNDSIPRAFNGLHNTITPSSCELPTEGRPSQSLDGSCSGLDSVVAA